MRRSIPHSGAAPARSPARRRRRAVRSSSTICVGVKLPNLCLCRGAGHNPRSTKRCRTPRVSGASLTMRATGRARYQKTLWAEFKARTVSGCYQAVSPVRQSRIPARPVLLDACGIGGTAGSTTPVGAMRARTGQGRDRLPSWPHPLWSSIQFATGYRSDRGSRRSCHTPVR